MKIKIAMPPIALRDAAPSIVEGMAVEAEDDDWAEPEYEPTPVV